jgi:hypothetical protein
MREAYLNWTPAKGVNESMEWKVWKAAWKASKKYHAVPAAVLAPAGAACTTPSGQEGFTMRVKAVTRQCPACKGICGDRAGICPTCNGEGEVLVPPVAQLAIDLAALKARVVALEEWRDSLVCPSPSGHHCITDSLVQPDHRPNPPSTATDHT